MKLAPREDFHALVAEACAAMIRCYTPREHEELKIHYSDRLLAADPRRGRDAYERLLLREEAPLGFGELMPDIRAGWESFHGACRESYRALGNESFPARGSAPRPFLYRTIWSERHIGFSYGTDKDFRAYDFIRQRGEPVKWVVEERLFDRHGTTYNFVCSDELLDFTCGGMVFDTEEAALKCIQDYRSTRVPLLAERLAQGGGAVGWRPLTLDERYGPK